jgi:formylglycine-generating enzyme required for sulfatase activity
MDESKSFGCGEFVAWPVGSKPQGASPYGAWDMAGNVWEWVADRYGGNYYASAPEANPQGPASGDSRVLRGGSWADVAALGGVRAAVRDYLSPDYRGPFGATIGLRCARSMAGAAAVTPGPTRLPTATPTLRAGATANPPGDAEYVRVPAGEFSMGSLSSDSQTNPDEWPVHTVYLDAYWIGRTEVTNAQFAAFVQATGHQTSAEEQGWGTV